MDNEYWVDQAKKAAKNATDMASKLSGDVPELVTVAWELYGDKHNPDDKLTYKEPTTPRNGDKRLVRYDQAAAMLAAKDAEIESVRRMLSSIDAGYGVYGNLLERAESAEKELAQIKAQLKDKNAVHIAMLRGDIAKLTETQIKHIYTAPADQTEEIERLREALRFYANKDNWENGRFEHGISKDGGHNVLTAIPSDAHNDYGEVARIALK